MFLTPYGVEIVELPDLHRIFIFDIGGPRSVGFNERFWFDRSGLPHTNQLHTVERFTRTGLDTVHYELTIDDPGA